MAGSTNIREFRIHLDKVAKTVVPALASQFHRKVCFTTLGKIVFRTPVDTGRARGNWQTSVGAPADSRLEVEDPTGASAIAQGARVIATLPPFSVCWIANNLPYIDPLENGWSKQAPNGMVAVTVSELESGLGIR